MYTDILQNDIIIISKKDKTKNWVRTIGHKKEDYIYTINIEKGWKVWEDEEWKKRLFVLY